MIRIWLWEEAPVELRDYPGLPGLTAGTVPVLLAHAPAAQGDEADLLGGMVAAWATAPEQRAEVYVVNMECGGLLLAGCLADQRPAPSEESAS